MDSGKERPGGYFGALPQSEQREIVRWLHGRFKTMAPVQDAGDCVQAALLFMLTAKAPLLSAPTFQSAGDETWRKQAVSALHGYLTALIPSAISAAFKGRGVHVPRSAHNEKPPRKQFSAKENALERSLDRPPPRSDGQGEQNSLLIASLDGLPEKRIPASDQKQFHAGADAAQLAEDRLTGAAIFQKLAKRMTEPLELQFFEALGRLAIQDGDSPQLNGRGEEGSKDRLFRGAQLNHQVILENLAKDHPHDGWTIERVRAVAVSYYKQCELIRPDVEDAGFIQRRPTSEPFLLPKPAESVVGGTEVSEGQI